MECADEDKSGLLLSWLQDFLLSVLGKIFTGASLDTSQPTFAVPQYNTTLGNEYHWIRIF